MAGMSLSTFQRHFKIVTVVSALQNQKHRRVQQARRSLRAENGEARQIAYTVGYEGPSQFIPIGVETDSSAAPHRHAGEGRYLPLFRSQSQTWAAGLRRP